MMIWRRVVIGLAAFVATCAIAVAQPSDRRFLWKITVPEGPPTFVMGSLHVLTPDYYPLPVSVEAAFASSTVLIEEVDLAEMSDPAVAMALLGKAMLTDGRTLAGVIDSTLYRKVVAQAEKSGVPVAALDRMKPWMAAVSLTLPVLDAAGFDADLGVDRHFFALAGKRGIERRGLETLAYQFDRLDQMAPGLQEAMLRSSLEDLDAQIANVKTIADAWARGDTATLEKELLGALRESPALYERLLVERNRNWVAPVERCLVEKTACFVVVGAAHLVGPDSLLAMLKAKGHKVDQQ